MRLLAPFLSICQRQNNICPKYAGILLGLKAPAVVLKNTPTGAQATIVALLYLADKEGDRGIVLNSDFFRTLCAESLSENKFEGRIEAFALSLDTATQLLSRINSQLQKPAPSGILSLPRKEALLHDVSIFTD